VSFYTDVIAHDARFHTTQAVHDIALLEPVTRAAVQAIIADAKAMGIALMAWETYRSRERQELLFKQHATKLQKVGVHHYGLACDLVRDIGGEPSWKGDFSFLTKLCAKHGLISGNDWGTPGQKHTFIDPCHVQRVAVPDQNKLFAGIWYPDAAYDPRGGK
jgi:hypothetical protein